MANLKQIKELERVLTSREEELKNSIEELKNKINDIQCDDCKDEADMAEATVDTYTLETLVIKQKEELEEVRNALKAIEKGTYGICQMCDEPIAIGRLRAKPFAKFCTSCREIYEEEINNKG